MDTDDVSKDVDEQVEEKEQKQEKQEQTNQRIENQKAYLNQVVELQENTKNDKYMKKEFPDTYEQIMKDYDQNKKDLVDVNKDIDKLSKDMPVIPMG